MLQTPQLLLRARFPLLSITGRWEMQNRAVRVRQFLLHVPASLPPEPQSDALREDRGKSVSFPPRGDRPSEPEKPCSGRLSSDAGTAATPLPTELGRTRTYRVRCCVKT